MSKTKTLLGSIKKS